MAVYLHGAHMEKKGLAIDALPWWGAHSLPNSSQGHSDPKDEPQPTKCQLGL